MKINTIRPNLTEITVIDTFEDGSTSPRIVVYSHKTPVIVQCKQSPNHRMIWYVTRKKHSNTTSRHIAAYMDKILASPPVDYIEADQDYIDRLAA